MNKHTKKFCQMLIILQLLCGITTYYLYDLDTDKDSLNVLKEYVGNVSEYMYDDEELESISKSNSISHIIVEFDNLKQKGLIWTDPMSLVHNMDEAESLYDTLLPDKVDKANKYIRPYIYTQSCYDIIHSNVANSDDYWEIQATYLEIKSLHEVLTFRNIYGIIYHRMNYIILSLRVTMILSCILVLVSVNIKYFKLTKQGEKNGIFKS